MNAFEYTSCESALAKVGWVCVGGTFPESNAIGLKEVAWVGHFVRGDGNFFLTSATIGTRAFQTALRPICLTPLDALKRAEAAFEDIRTHWRPSALPDNAAKMQAAIAADHEAVSAAIKGCRLPQDLTPLLCRALAVIENGDDANEHAELIAGIRAAIIRAGGAL